MHDTAVEAKLLLEKHLGNLVLAYNGVIEQEWEGDKYGEDKIELKNLLGASVRVSSRMTVGGEYLWETETENWGGRAALVAQPAPPAATRRKRNRDLTFCSLPSVSSNG